MILHTIAVKLHAHRAERAAQRAYMRTLADDMSRLDMLEWTPERLDRLAADVWPDERAREIAQATWIVEQQKRLR